jgi:hypothetical protein
MRSRLIQVLKSRIQTISLCFIAFSSFPLVGSADVIWVDWQTVLPNGDVEGTANVQGGTVTVTYSGERQFVQTSCGTNYWIPSTPYISATVPNPPPDCDIIALSQATAKTLTFSEPVANVFFAVVSLNGNGYRFDRDFDILSFDCGYWGCGTLAKEVNPPTYDLIGSGEPHGVIQLLGSFTSVSWTSLSNENWNGFSIAFEETVANLKSTVMIEASSDGSEPSTDGEFLVSSSLEAGSGGLTVNYSVSNASTATAGSDYTALSGSVVIPEGETSATVSVEVINDDEIEATETVIVNLLSEDAYNVGNPSEATVNITSDDVPPPPPPPAPAEAIPTTGTWGLLIMFLTLGLIGVAAVRRIG